MKQATSPQPEADARPMPDPQLDEPEVRSRRRLEVPSLIGCEPQTAVAQLRELGLVPAVESEETSASEQVGVVFGQQPAPGADAQRGDVVELAVGIAAAVEEPRAPEEAAELEDDDWFAIPDSASLSAPTLPPTGSADLDVTPSPSDLARRLSRKPRPRSDQPAVQASRRDGTEEPGLRRGRRFVLPSFRALALVLGLAVSFALGALSSGRDRSSPHTRDRAAQQSKPQPFLSDLESTGRPERRVIEAPDRPGRRRVAEGRRASPHRHQATHDTAASDLAQSPARVPRCEWCLEQPANP